MLKNNVLLDPRSLKITCYWTPDLNCIICINYINLMFNYLSLLDKLIWHFSCIPEESKVSSNEPLLTQHGSKDRVTHLIPNSPRSLELLLRSTVYQCPPEINDTCTETQVTKRVL